MRAEGLTALSCAKSLSRAPVLPRCAAKQLGQQQRHRSTATPDSTLAELSPRWLSDVKQRLGHCITWGLKPDQTQEAGKILQEIARDWRDLLAGREGFLTSKQRRSTFRQQVVWGEQDSMGHVNNVVYNRYAETGRVDWFLKLARVDPSNAEAWRTILTPKDLGLLLKSIRTDFKFPMKYPDHVSIYHKLGTEPVEGTDSFIMDVMILSEVHQRPAARCVEDCVLYDYRVAKKTPLRPFMLDVLRETWKLQEETKRINSQRVVALLDRVRKLEKGSWDREGAVEDMGSASS
ncbi:hypothetical protein CKM354_000131200 [Cercospora kikuchii]|uniref:Uncharacterized protein n=1 Tax=Cercospora kikuchii TaxID=84275 RepID=A0A9P3CAG6_9PEZI|nr:uncharacterized protein CKM354_000131200 [Cercospora kikuchii]GIZ37881.1 hypothetical protein CKM354_000131200 [Cercospora kikuchii]